MEVERTRIQHLESHVNRLTMRVENMDKELESLESAPMETSVMEASAELSKVEQEAAALSETVDEFVAKNFQSCETNVERAAMLSIRSVETYSKCRGVKCLSKLCKKAALGHQGKSTEKWLAQSGLNNKPRLLEQIEVDAGWENAVETVFRGYSSSHFSGRLFP